MLSVDTGSFLAIVGVAALAALIVGIGGRRVLMPVVVLELVLGIVIGPDVLDLAQSDAFVEFFASLGLGMLFFFAGYEIDFDRIKGKPLELGIIAWFASLALAYGIGGVLAGLGIVVSFLYTGSALATTAIGTLIPVLRDNGQLRTNLGTYLLAGGAIGEFGPILLITLILSTTHPIEEAGILIGFIVLALGLGIASVRYSWKGFNAMETTLESSSQLAVRIAVLLIFGLLALAGTLGLDILLGGFVAGMITRVALRGAELRAFESKLTAVGFGFLIPFFFIGSGIAFDLDALGSAAAVGKLFLFFALFLVVRGVPAMLLYKKVLDRRERITLAVFTATELPLVVAITTLAVDAGEMRTSTAAGLVGAAIISTLVFPFIGLALLKKDEADDAPGSEPPPLPDLAMP